jgi:ABC-type multidrug transport system permease subunit
VTATTPAPVHGDAGRPLAVAGALTWRNLVGIRRVPATFVPVVVMPVFFVIAFSGQYRGIVDIPGFATDNVLSWYTPMAVLMGASFAGVGTAFSVARDLETGFFDRLLLSPAARAAIMGGSLLAGAARGLITFTLVTAVGLAGGAAVPGGVAGILSLLVASLGVSTVATLWALGLVYRIKSQNAGPIVQVGIFVGLFLTTAQAPLEVITGWLHPVARFNPVSHILGLARQGFLEGIAWSTTWPGLVAIAGLVAVTLVFAARGMRSLTP